VNSTEVTAGVTFNLTEGARFNEAMSRLSQYTFVPKGIYRFRIHEAANQHVEDCPVRGMGRSRDGGTHWRAIQMERKSRFCWNDCAHRRIHLFDHRRESGTLRQRVHGFQAWGYRSNPAGETY
jgi:hypothetical protein